MASSRLLKLDFCWRRLRYFSQSHVSVSFLDQLTLCHTLHSHVISNIQGYLLCKDKFVALIGEGVSAPQSPSFQRLGKLYRSPINVFFSTRDLWCCLENHIIYFLWTQLVVDIQIVSIDGFLFFYLKSERKLRNVDVCERQMNELWHRRSLCPKEEYKPHWYTLRYLTEVAGTLKLSLKR